MLGTALSSYNWCPAINRVEGIRASKTGIMGLESTHICLFVHQPTIITASERGF